MWNIYLKDDGLEENHEKFDVVLKTPKNAVLGQRNKATIEIVDPRNGRKKFSIPTFCSFYIKLRIFLSSRPVSSRWAYCWRRWEATSFPKPTTRPRSWTALTWGTHSRPKNRNPLGELSAKRGRPISHTLQTLQRWRTSGPGDLAQSAPKTAEDSG